MLDVLGQVRMLLTLSALLEPYTTTACVKVRGHIVPGVTGLRAPSSTATESAPNHVSWTRHDGK